MENVYIYPCNVESFDINNHFQTNKTIVWRSVSDIKIHDIVYVYVGKTMKEIKYKCRVLAEDVEGKTLQMNTYAIPEGKLAQRCSYILLELEKEFKDGTYPLIELKANGMGQFMVPMKANEQLRLYLSNKGGEE